MSRKPPPFTPAEAQALIQYIIALPAAPTIPKPILEVRDKAVLYCLHFQDKTLYIGHTCNPLRRYSHHRSMQHEPHTFIVLRTGTLPSMKALEQRVIRAAHGKHRLRNILIYAGRKPTRPHSEGVSARVQILHNQGLLDVSAHTIRRRMAGGETFERAITPRKHAPRAQHMFVFRGEQVGVYQLSKRFNISYQTILNRVHNQKLTVEQALDPNNLKNGKKLLPPH